MDEVRAIDEAQRMMVAASDIVGLTALAHPNLRINAPGNRVLTREQFLKNIRMGEIAAEQFERTPEEIIITGDVAVVMVEQGLSWSLVQLLSRWH